MKLKSTCVLPSQWNDLVDEKDNVIATVYTLKERQSDFEDAKVGIIKAEDGIYDVVVEAEELTDEVIGEAIGNLMGCTKENYEFTKE